MRLVAPDMASLKMRWHMRPEGMAVMPVSPSIHVLSVMAEWLSPELWRQSPTMRRKLRIQALRAYQAAIHEVAVPSRAADALWLEFWSDRWIWRDAPGPGEALLWLNCDPTLHDDMDFPGHCVLIVDGDRPQLLHRFGGGYWASINDLDGAWIDTPPDITPSNSSVLKKPSGELSITNNEWLAINFSQGMLWVPIVFPAQLAMSFPPEDMGLWPSTPLIVNR
jgi:hypothetical protein